MVSMMASPWMLAPHLPSPPPVNTLVHTLERNKQALPISGTASTMRMPALPLLEMIIEADDDAIISQPSQPTTMSNHNNTSYNDGYDSNGLLPCYDDIADMGKDPDSYKGDANLLIFPPKDPPTAIATEKCSTLTIHTIRKYNVHQIKYELKKRGLKLSEKRMSC